MKNTPAHKKHTKILSILFEVRHTLFMFKCSRAENTWSHFRKEACPLWCCHTNLWEEAALGTAALPEKKGGRWMKSEFKYAEMIWPNLRGARWGRPNKSPSEVWKSTTQMNGVNLPGRALRSCWDDTLWNLVCYPLLPLTLEPAPSHGPPSPSLLL